jgi:hypothetical protein
LSADRGRRAHRGLAAVETLLALPLLLLVGGGALQFALVYQARQALGYALTEAARSGSVAYADPEAIDDGLARGLLPWLFGADGLTVWQLNLVRSRAHLAEARALGRMRLVQQSPTEASFADWSEPARDAGGAMLAGLRQIPNDDLVHRTRTAVPASGTAGLRAGEPVGAVSGQTLADANLLRLRLEYGVPLSVPVIGRLIGWTLRAWHGCEVPSARRLGAVDLGVARWGLAVRPDVCLLLGTAAQAGPARLPVSVSATVRMQSPARWSGPGGERAPIGAAGAQDAAGAGPTATGPPGISRSASARRRAAGPGPAPVFLPPGGG